MKVYDISQEVFGCVVFPGDPKPEQKEVLRIKNGAVCNLSAFSMCAHNGTHVDAPFHFIEDGKTIDQIRLEAVVGPCYVYTKHGEVTQKDAQIILEDATAAGGECSRRILLRGSAVVTEEAAKYFAKEGVLLIGNESQTVGPEASPKEVHMILLGADIVLLEGIRLSHITDGAYVLNAAPLNLSGFDGAPCRAILMQP